LYRATRLFLPSLVRAYTILPYPKKKN